MTERAQSREGQRPAPRGGGRVVVFPAVSHMRFSGRPIFFLFSMTQVADILKVTPVYPVPFSPAHVKGMARWRGRVAPVILPEALFDPAAQCPAAAPEGRMVVVRAASGGGAGDGLFEAICMAGGPVRILSLPLDARPVAPPGPPMPAHAARAVYEWEGGWLVAPALERALSGAMGEPAGVSQSEEISIGANLKSMGESNMNGRAFHGE